MVTPSSSITNPSDDLSIASLAPKSLSGLLLKIIGPVLDQLLGINKLRKIYLEHQLSGLEKQAFSKKLLKALGVNIRGSEDVLSKLPKSGRCIVVCNHPYGMIEGIIIAHLLTTYRKDTKIMANVGLKIFKEINDYFIFANPLQPKSPINTSAIKQCFNHINNDGLLVIFPAGRVSFYQKEKQRISDGHWNRLAIQIASKTDSAILPIFISGTNSHIFHFLGRIYYRFRLLMLAREMFKMQQHEISLKTNNIIDNKQLEAFKSTEEQNNFIRLQCYLNDEKYFSPWPDNSSQINQQQQTLKTILPKSNSEIIKKELVELPAEQHLLDFKTFSVYYGYQHQIPTCVREITRLREVTFRPLNEGSGEACDGDKFDTTYMHLFIFDHKEEEIIGAYRIGQTDLLQQQKGKSALYLAQMFTFDKTFINQQQPCLEMGRSFIIAKHQNSFHGLLLLWKGIGAFVCKNPRYRTLYGTVSLSKNYDPRSISLIDRVMVTKTLGVSAKTAFSGQLHPEVNDFITKEPLNIQQLSALISGIESDQKEVPILLKQYHKLGAVFHCTGIDTNFNQTPGLLLSVNLPKAPDKLLKLYLGKERASYLAYNNEFERGFIECTKQ
jgi:putative hemolysin